ncbi:MAG: aldo/keto reductase [Deltaproteobacteria bacterium]|nr:aldo/keto reductase [Deltaproteobacteria bacterium]
MTADFGHSVLPSPLSVPVLRLGVAGNYGLAAADIPHAADRGANYWVWTPNFKKVTPGLREVLAARREAHVVAMLGVAYTAAMVRRGVEKALRMLGTDYLDVYQLSWLGRGSSFGKGIQEALLSLRHEGKVRALGCSIHDRQRAGALARDSILDLLMIRYNAAHPGAEQDVFPHLGHRNPAVVAYTATSWRQLLRPLGIRMPPWPGPVDDGPAPPPLTPSLCYRFCLSSPHVHVVLTGPKDRAQLDANLDALAAGPLSAEEDAWVRMYGKAVRAKRRLPFA